MLIRLKYAAEAAYVSDLSNHVGKLLSNLAKTVRSPRTAYGFLYRSNSTTSVKGVKKTHEPIASKHLEQNYI